MRSVRLFASLAALGMVAVLGAGATPQALATPSEAKLELNENCYISTWACWAPPGYDTTQQPPSRVTIAAGGELKFADNADFDADVIWMGSTPPCSGVPTSPSAQWEGGCQFAQAGTYDFESPTLFKDASFNYRQYEVVVEAARIAGAPAVTTGAATGVSETQATLEGEVNPEGKATKYHFKYGLTGSYGEETLVTSAGEGSTAKEVSALTMNLTPGKTYHYQLVAENAAGTTEGVDHTFNTASPPGPPSVTTDQASPIGQTEATLNGKVDPEGGAEAEYFFEWGAGSGGSYEHTTTAVSLPSDGAEHQVSASVTGLTPGGEYHFRLVAKNKLGSVQGNDLTLMAAPTPPTKEPPAKEPSPTPSPTGGNTTATASSSPLSGQPAVKLASGPLFESVKLPSTQHSSSVHGTIDISQAEVGGQLEVALLTTTTSLAMAKHPSKARVGHLVRSSLKAGVVSFTVSLTSKAKAALRPPQASDVDGADRTHTATWRGGDGDEECRTAPLSGCERLSGPAVVPCGASCAESARQVWLIRGKVGGVAVSIGRDHSHTPEPQHLEEP
jgi:hypothetical protein